MSRHLSEENKKQTSAALKGRKLSDETRAKISKAKEPNKIQTTIQLAFMQQGNIRRANVPVVVARALGLKNKDKLQWDITHLDEGYVIVRKAPGAELKKELI